MERKAQAVIQKSMKGTSSDANKRVIRSMIVKAVGEDTSRSISEDPFQGIDGVVTPPYPQLELCVLKENSTELRQCIDSMATNIDSFGYRLVGRIQDDENNDDMKAERSKIRAFLDNINFEDDITSLRMKTRRELEECGNAYWELVPYMNRVGIASIEKLQSHTMRLTIQDPESTVVDKYFYDEETNTIKSKKVKRKFRRYIQLVNEKKVYFKEWGDPRNISYKDGKVIPDEELSTRRGELANPVYHFKIESNRSPYGIPRYVGALFCVYGSRASEEINYITFQNNNIPSMIVTVSNGQLTDSSIARIQEFVDEKIKGDSNRSSFLILEAEPADETQLNPGTMKMDIKDLSGIQKEDQLFQAYDENNSEKIRRAWRIPPIFVGKSSDYNRSCYSEDTETLTENGWKYYWEIQDGERIATFNPETNKIEYHEPNGGLLLYDYSGEMYHFNSQQLDILVTPDHDMWVGGIKSEEFKKVKSQDVSDYSAYFKFRNAAINSEYKKIEIIIPEMVLTDGPNSGVRKQVTLDPKFWVEFVTAFVADGATTPEYVNGKKRCMYNIQFASNKERKITMFRRIMARFKEYGFNVNNEYINKEGMTCFSMSDKVLWGLLRSNFGTHAVNKHLSPEMTLLDQELSDIIIRTLQNTDGTVDTREGRTCWSYSTTSKVLADQVQTILIHNGHRANIICDDKLCYRVLVTPGRDLTTCRDRNITNTYYSGKVYCFNVPNHLFVTRRNGKVTIQGNTAQVSRKLADEQVFGPERQDFDRFMNRLLISEFGMKFSKFASNSASVTNDEDLVKILSGSEKTGGVTPNLARQILSEVLNKELPLYKRDEIEFDPDVPMSVTLVQMAKSVAGNDQTGTIAPVQGQFPQSNEVSEEVTKNVMAMLKKALYKDIYNEIVYEI